MWVDTEDYFPQLVVALDTPGAGQALHEHLRSLRIATGIAVPRDLVVLCAQCTDADEVRTVANALASWMHR